MNKDILLLLLDMSFRQNLQDSGFHSERAPTSIPKDDYDRVSRYCVCRYILFGQIPDHYSRIANLEYLLSQITPVHRMHP